MAREIYNEKYTTINLALLSYSPNPSSSKTKTFSLPPSEFYRKNIRSSRAFRFLTDLTANSFECDKLVSPRNRINVFRQIFIEVIFMA